MANRHDIAHRFANKQEGKNGRICAGNVRYEGRNYYSYSTVFGQWVDIEKNVCVVFEGSTSPSSSKHKLGKGFFPDDVHVFPYDDGGGCYGCCWHGCDLVGEYARNDKEFDFYARCTLIDYYVGKIYAAIAAINGGKKKGLDAEAASTISEYWPYVEHLCALYKDTSVPKWLRLRKGSDWADKRNVVRALYDGVREVSAITDYIFGEGTFKAYYDYCARYRKAADKKEKLRKLAFRLGFSDPYEKWHSSNETGCPFSPDELRKLTARERLDWHFSNLAKLEHIKGSKERDKKYEQRKRNAFKWITGYEPQKRTYWNGDFSYLDDVKQCRNKFTGEEYDLMDDGMNLLHIYWAEDGVLFNYDDFRKSEDKEKWIEDFYAKCEEVAHNIYAVSTLVEFNAPQEQRGRYSFDKAFVLTDEVMDKLNGCAESIAIVEDFIRRQDKHYEDEAAQERARAIERARVESERKAEEEYRAQVKQEQIDECMSRGTEGKRDLWRKHLKRICDFDIDDTEFYYGGNVLLRLNLNKDRVETSKDIRMPIEVAKKFFKLIKGWHDRTLVFKPIEIDTKGSGKYTISSFENDILTAGCHRIAYTEMERMYNEIQGL